MKSKMLVMLMVVAITAGSNAAIVTENGGDSLATAQVLPTDVGVFTTTVAYGVFGDAVRLGSGIVTTTGGARQQISLAGGTPGGLFILASTPATGVKQDGTGYQYSDNTFTTEIFFDDDDGPGNYPEFRNGEVNINADGTIHFELGEYGDNGEITYGYDVLDVTNATRINDFFRFDGLVAGSSLAAEIMSDGLTYGFSDAALKLYDSTGTQLAGGDGDTSTGPNPYLEAYSTTVPLDGIVLIEITQSGRHPGGTYQLAVDGESVPEPATMVLLALGGLGILRRKKA